MNTPAATATYLWLIKTYQPRIRPIDEWDLDENRPDLTFNGVEIWLNPYEITLYDTNGPENPDDNPPNIDELGGITTTLQYSDPNLYNKIKTTIGPQLYDMEDGRSALP